MSNTHRRGVARGRSRLAAGLLASTILAAGQAHAQTLSRAGNQDTKDASATVSATPAPGAGATLAEVVVTAQKREENLQKVPLSIQALGAQRLQQLNVTQFNDYVKFLPSVTYQTLAPSQTNIYIRGVASGGDGNHSGPSPSVGVYLDEQPITTIQGALDVHVYDIARIESLAGPQGTLYGASSESGTLRIITNKPDPKAFAAGYDVEGNHVDHGDFGGVAEGFVNIPINDKAAVRLVAFDEHDSGYIDNVFGTRTYPVSGITINNKSRAENHYNDVDTYGGRAALRIDLNENWTVTPSLIGQVQRSRGVFGYDSTKGDLQVTHFYPESLYDRWVQAAMTVEGHIRNFDVVYSGGYFQRNVNSQTDYTDYSFFYDTLFGSGAYINDAKGNLINPSQRIDGVDQFTKESHELRISSPKQDRFRFVGGLFYERQVHDIQQNYLIDGLAPSLSISNHPGELWLTDQVRIDRDAAVFGEGTYDITGKLSVTGGLRVFESRNSLRGFFGFGSGFSSHTGEAACFKFQAYRTAPCLNVDKDIEEVSETYKGNLTYKIDANKLVYFTASSGYRPGGVNRAGNLPPYQSDFLYNYEVGWKTSSFENRVRWNGAVFHEDWDNFQFSFLGANSLTQIANAGAAQIDGVESDVAWQPMAGLNFTAAGTYVDAELSKPYCGSLNPDGSPVTDCASPLAPKGQQLPVTPHFKGNATARYGFPVLDMKAHVQGALVYQGDSYADLRTLERTILGRQRAYTAVDFAFGLDRGQTTFEIFLKNAFNERGQVYRYAECTPAVCGAETYIVPIQPLTVGVRFGQRF